MLAMALHSGGAWRDGLMETARIFVIDATVTYRAVCLDSATSGILDLRCCIHRTAHRHNGVAPGTPRGAGRPAVHPVVDRRTTCRSTPA
jgi:hypothetical protein